MEVFIFPLPEIRAYKSKFVEARLHSDAVNLDLRARIAELIKTVARSTAQPIYVILDPATETEIGRYNGAVIGEPEKFEVFLSEMLAGLP